MTSLNVRPVTTSRLKLFARAVLIALFALAFFRVRHQLGSPSAARLTQRNEAGQPGWTGLHIVSLSSFESPRQGSAVFVIAQLPLFTWGTAALLVHGLRAENSPVRPALGSSDW